MVTRTRADAGDEVVDKVARAGLVAKGLLYAVIGLLAGRIALGSGGQSEASQRGAIAAVARQPFGGVLLGVLAAGLTGYAVWRAVQAVRGADGESSMPEPLLRATFTVRALTYAALALLAWRTLLGAAASGSSEQSVTARLLEAPLGQLLVVAVGAVVVAVGLYQVWHGASRGFRDELSLREMSGRERSWFVRLGVVGHVARGAVFLLVGGFLIRAALRAQPDQGVGFDAALQEVADTPYGTAILAGIAVGLVVFGVFCFVQARFARVEEVD